MHCFQNKLQTAKILEFPGGSGISGNERVQPSLAKEGSLPTPTMEVDPSSIEEVQGRRGERSDLGDTHMAWTVLVADGDEVQQGQHEHANHKDKLFDRMEIIRSCQEAQGLDQPTLSYLEGSTRRKTKQTYDGNGKK